MNDKDMIIEATVDTEPMEIIEGSAQELSILVTDKDKYGSDIIAMSDFFSGYIKQLTTKMSTRSMIDVGVDIPIADLGIINDVIHHADVLMKGEYGYIPDFENLPRDIRRKLDKGIYKIGKSRQVDGDMRAVILDENDVRVKDITLKQVLNDPGTLETSRSIANQLQMRQIYAKLDGIQELQSYQIDRDRDRDIMIPFLNARDYILRAQTQSALEERRENMFKAADELTRAINGVYTDMSTSAMHLAKLTRWPIFQRREQIKSYIGYIIRDLQLATKYTGVQMHVFDYLEDRKSSQLVFDRYQHVMLDFLNKSINFKDQSAASLIHLNYPYDEHNLNSWYEFAKELEPVLVSSMGSHEAGKKIFLVSVEDVENGKNN